MTDNSESANAAIVFLSEQGFENFDISPTNDAGWSCMLFRRGRGAERILVGFAHGLTATESAEKALDHYRKLLEEARNRAT